MPPIHINVAKQDGGADSTEPPLPCLVISPFFLTLFHEPYNLVALKNGRHLHLACEKERAAFFNNDCQGEADQVINTV